MANPKYIVAGIIAIVVALLTLTAISRAPPSSEPLPPSSANASADMLASLASHSTPDDCWTIISGRLYNITAYLPVHPGGPVIRQACGRDATELFATKGEAGRDHSDFAKRLLNQFLVGGANSTNGSATPDNTLPPPKTNQTASNSSSNTTQIPASPISVQMTEVAGHNRQADCWIVVSGKVYDVTAYITVHPGGVTMITRNCGKDATTDFNTKGGSGSSHSSYAKNLLASYLIGSLNTTQLPPTASITSPTSGQVFPAGTTQTTLRVTTSKAATCRWDVSNKAYASMANTFTTTGGTSHSTTLSGLVNGTSYTRYVRCIDSSGIAMVSSASVTFSVMAPVIVPPAGITMDELALHNAQSDCWIVVSSNVYDVTAYIPVHPGGVTMITRNCGKDATTDFNTKGGSGSSHSSYANSLLASYLVGPINQTQLPPTASITAPSAGQAFPAGTTQTNLRVTTSKAATCRWDVSNKAYASMANTFTTTGGTSHSTTLSGLANGTSYTRYVRCIDSSGIAMTSSASVTFSVMAPVIVPPTGITMDELALHNAQGDCWILVSSNVYDVTAYIPVHPGGVTMITRNCGKDATADFNTKGGSGSSHSSYALGLLANYLVGPINQTQLPPTASITAPSAGQAFPSGTTQATLSVTTSKNASCRWDTSDKAYGSMVNTFTTTGGTSHSTTVSGLANGTSYTRYVRCIDSSGIAMASSASVTFSVMAPVIVPPTGITMTEVAAHSTQSDCWIVVSGKAYDVTVYIPIHPGGVTMITRNCGKDATTDFGTRGGTGTHSTNARNLLASYYVGDIIGGGAGTGGNTTTNTTSPKTVEQVIQEAYPGATIINVNYEDDGRKEVKIRYNGSTITVWLDSNNNILGGGG